MLKSKIWVVSASDLRSGAHPKRAKEKKHIISSHIIESFIALQFSMCFWANFQVFLSCFTLDKQFFNYLNLYKQH